MTLSKTSKKVTPYKKKLGKTKNIGNIDDPVKPICEGGGYNTNPLAPKQGGPSAPPENANIEKNVTKKNTSKEVKKKSSENDSKEGEKPIVDNDVMDSTYEKIINPEFRIQASAYLLTYNRKPNPEDGTGPFTTEDFEKLLLFLSEKEPTALTIGLEKGKNDNYHLHAFVSKKTDCTSKFFEFEGVCPNIQINKARGKGKLASVMRGHYYAGIADKIGVVKNYSTLVNENKFDLMSSKWTTDLVRQGKMLPKNGVDDLFKWRNNDPYPIRKMESLYNHYVLEQSKARSEEIMERARKKMKPFRVINKVVEWQKQYIDPSELRYDFLVLVGPTKSGKSEFARSLFKNPFEMKTNIVWQGYNSIEHDGIILHDVQNVFRYILNNRELFQANGVHATGASATNCYIYNVDVLAVPIVIVTNRDGLIEHKNEWIQGNSITYQLGEDEKLFETDELPVPKGAKKDVTLKKLWVKPGDTFDHSYTVVKE